MMGVTVTHRYPCTVNVIGVVQNVSKPEVSKGSGIKIRCTVHNQHRQHERWDLHVPVLAFGRSAEEIIKAAKSKELIHILGRLAMVNAAESIEGPRLEVIAQVVLSLDEYCDNEEATP